MIDRKCLEDCLQKCCCGNDRPSCPVRLIVALRRDCKVSWETKTHAGRNCMAVAQKHMENIAEHFRRAMGIGVRQVGFGWSGFHSKMIQLASAVFQTSANISQTIGLRQLAEDHRHKMCPTVKGLFSLVSIVFHDYFFKFSLRYQIQHLTKKTD